jgi:hypothetical protein
MIGVGLIPDIMAGASFGTAFTDGHAQGRQRRATVGRKNVKEVY